MTQKGLLCLYILYWVSKVLVCLYILEKVEIWSGVTDASHTDRQTTEDRASQLLYSIQFKLSHAILMCNLSGVLSRGKCGKRIVRSSSREILKKIVATLLSKVDEYIVVYICKNLAARYHTFRTVLFKRIVFWRLMY